MFGVWVRVGSYCSRRGCEKVTGNVNERLREDGGGHVWDWLEEEVGTTIYLRDSWYLRLDGWCENSDRGESTATGTPVQA